MGVDTRARAVALLIATFAAGAITGAAIWPRIEPRRAEVLASREAESSEFRCPLEMLGLTSDERARLHVIARRWRPRSANEFEEVRRRVADMENGMFAEMLLRAHARSARPVPQVDSEANDTTRRS